MYTTIKATVRKGKIELLESVNLPEDATLLVTFLDDVSLENLTLGEHLVSGLQDVLEGRYDEVTTSQELEQHLENILDPP